MARKGQENLIPQNKRTKSEQREIAKKGGIASGKSRREKKDIKAYLKILLESELKTKDGKVMQGAERVATAFFTLAANGDMRAISKLFDVMYPQEQKIDLTSSDGSMTPKSGAVFNLDGLTDEQLDALAQQAFTGTK